MTMERSVAPEPLRSTPPRSTKRTRGVEVFTADNLSMGVFKDPESAAEELWRLTRQEIDLR
jgi:hypothetical protein